MFPKISIFVLLLANVYEISHAKAALPTWCHQLTISCPPFQHLLSERLMSLGIMGEPEVPPLRRETQSLGQQMLERWA